MAFLGAELMKEQKSFTITGVKARQIYDSRGWFPVCSPCRLLTIRVLAVWPGTPTIEVEVTTQKGTYRAAVPSGASTGIYEVCALRYAVCLCLADRPRLALIRSQALELRDDDKKDNLGKSVHKAVDNVNKIIAPALLGLNPVDQKRIDELMVQKLDGSKNEWGWSKAKLGANAILGVSLAVCRAGADAAGVPLYQHIANLAGNKELVLPVPAFNIINGGKHAGNKLAMQEFMILPTEAKSFGEALKMGAEVYHHLKKVIVAAYGQDACNVGGTSAPIFRLVVQLCSIAHFCWSGCRRGRFRSQHPEQQGRSGAGAQGDRQRGLHGPRQVRHGRGGL